MAYNGYLIKVGNYSLPLSFIKAETYKVTKCGQDLDSSRDAYGVLHRNALDHFCNKVEFNTIPMRNEQMEVLLANIRSQYTNATEKKANVEVYIPETNSYVTQDMYVPDIEFEIKFANNEYIIYAETRIAFIAY